VHVVGSVCVRDGDDGAGEGGRVDRAAVLYARSGGHLGGSERNGRGGASESGVGPWAVNRWGGVK
jgi:hypothetical protein